WRRMRRPRGHASGCRPSEDAPLWIERDAQQQLEQIRLPEFTALLIVPPELADTVQPAPAVESLRLGFGQADELVEVLLGQRPEVPGQEGVEVEAYGRVGERYETQSLEIAGLDAEHDAEVGVDARGGRQRRHQTGHNLLLEPVLVDGLAADLV